MRRLRHATAAALLAVLLITPVQASAASLQDHGWWWRAQTGLLGAQLPPPPDVPEDGLLVERAPDGATSIAALRFRLSEGESDPVLTLTVASGDSPAAAIAACQTNRTAWTGDHGGRWDTAPSFDCEAGRVDGAASEDGATWTWELAPLVRDGGIISVMLVDGTEAPFRVAFEPPSDASLTTTSAPPPPPEVPDPGGPPPGGETAPPPGGETAPPPSDGGQSPPVFVPPVVTPETTAPPAPAPPPEPEVAAPPGGAPTQPVPQAQPTATPAAEETGLSPLAFALILAVVLLLGADVMRDRAVIAEVARGGRRTEGGIGRFARERSAPPDPLW